jgi:hypothetical protein
MDRMRWRLLGSALLILALTGCSGPGLFAPLMGSVTGHVMIRACGGAYREDQSTCPMRPAAGARVVFQKDGNAVTATTDSTGAYRIDLRPGIYSIQATSGKLEHVAGPRQVTVTAGKTVTADFTYVLHLL